MLLIGLLAADVALAAGAVGVSLRYDHSRGRNWKLRVLAFLVWAALIAALALTWVFFSFAGMNDANPD
jgi:hypothetical protein